MRQRKPRLILFAKAPIKGYVKTRLIPAIGAHTAKELHKSLLEHSLKTALSCNAFDVELQVSEPHPFFVHLRNNYKFTLTTQRGYDLGERMSSAFMHSHRPTLLMGSDCPVIDQEILSDCLRAIEQKKLVLLPAEDGGYGLIGLPHSDQHICETLFKGVPWGTNQVLELTRARIQALQLKVAEPAVIWDVDREQDLAKLAQLKSKSGAKLWVPAAFRKQHPA